MPDEAVQVARALLNNDHSSGDPLEQFIHFFEDTTLETLDASDQQRTPEEMLNDCVIRGKTAPLDACIPFLLETYAAEDILNELLVPAMKEVGRLFNDGILQLPFVLKSAEVMKQAVAMIKPYMKSDQRAAGRAKLVLATVSGDVHDIGKNLVDIILSNNGFEVINLGTKVPVEQMMAAIREHKADVLGMSGLLVKSAAIMAENIKALAGSDIQVPVLLGGAALTPDFVADTCQPLYSLPVVYCRDAFEGLTRMREYADHGMLETTYRRGSRSSDPQPEAPPEVVDRDIPPPQCPFFGWRTVTDINLHDVYPLLNEIALIRGRWGYRRGKLSREAYDEILSQEVYPRLERLKIDCVRNGIFRPAVAYGYFHCRAEGEKLVVYPEENDERTISLTFPRQARSPYLAIPDYFRADEDVVGFMVVTLGPHVQRESSDQMDKAAYRDYYLLHGFAVEVTDALAEFWHGVIRREWGFEDGALSMQDYITQQYRGSRYGFGYPACPDLSMNRICCDLVHADRIGVSVSENDMMIPEVTTSALVAHHPQARYFYIA
jgi:5-methyltetrahydrofolate--homocysteine methyltransferase